MPINRLSDLQLGSIDGKHEYFETSEDAHKYFDTFLLPETINEKSLLSGDKFIIRGFRGTGKTSLLRWVAKRLRDDGAQGQFVLFKTDLSESKRAEISRQAGIKWESGPTAEIEFTQDFKEAWQWFLHRKIAEILQEQFQNSPTPEFKKYLNLLGIADTPWFEKLAGGFPKLESAKIKIKAMFGFIEGEFKGDISTTGTKTVPFSTVLEKLDRVLEKIQIKVPIYLCLDEMEVFFHSVEQYNRDLRMVRDLIFSISSFVTFVRSRKLPIKLYTAVRSEVLDAVGVNGQEVSRVAQDRGFNIAWHFEKRSLKHPLFNMVRRKLWSSEALMGLDLSKDPIEQYFAKTVSGVDLEVFILDQSFYKPRDIVLRLLVAQEQFPLSPIFDGIVLSKTDVDYSAKMWEEVAYELSAIYEAREVEAIENLLFGVSQIFELPTIAERLRLMSSTSEPAQEILRRRGIKVILQDLYRLGAIGNYFKSSGSIRQRWIHRGEAKLVESQAMAIHLSLHKRLSVLAGSARTKKELDYDRAVSCLQDRDTEEFWGKSGNLGAGRTSRRSSRSRN